jgi:hypothetical protein
MSSKRPSALSTIQEDSESSPVVTVSDKITLRVVLMLNCRFIAYRNALGLRVR